MASAKCPICGTNNCDRSSVNPLDTRMFFTCPICGRYELKWYMNDVDYEDLDRNQLASYLFYHRYLHDSFPTEYRYHTTLSKDICDNYKAEFNQGIMNNGNPVHMDRDIINTWYPKSFNERVDYIIRYLGDHNPHIGQAVSFTYEEMLSLLFIDRFEIDNQPISRTSGNIISRDKTECNAEANYMLDSLKESGLIGYDLTTNCYIHLTPKGYAKVDAIQRNTAEGKSVLVAMKFGDDTKNLREAIRQGITDAGYVAIFIDEVQHNDFITPELLKHIRDSKFVVVDLTHKNNGAYFEEGYAMGLGKSVIQLCRKNRKLHFDIAQKNTIMWDTESDIPERLCNRIKATID